ncbi:hypothetical protein N7535_000156 [Penicillium sp. DV-2018c]|nr:hypothetical protein N7535_000156 [Penicillium sp. DV-2018c]
MSDNRGHLATAGGHAHQKSDDSIVVKTSSGLNHATFVHEKPGDIFDAPNGAALLHACNCHGKWDRGLGHQFRERYPAAYEIYRKHCVSRLQKPISHKIPDLSAPELHVSVEVHLPLGTALLIPPQKSDFPLHRRRHWIVCLFVSKDYGTCVDTQDMIISSTWAALLDLKEQLVTLYRRPKSGVIEQAPTGLYSGRLCTGPFNVSWERIQKLIPVVGLRINVYHPYEPSTRGRRPIQVQAPSEEHVE